MGGNGPLLAVTVPAEPSNEPLDLTAELGPAPSLAAHRDGQNPIESGPEIAMEFIDRVDLEIKPRAQWQARLRVRLGELLEHFGAPARELAELERRAYVARARSPGSRLTESEIAELETFMKDVQELPQRRAYFQGRPIEETFQGLATGLVEKIVTSDPEVRSVLNIGLHYAWNDHEMAKKFAHVDFTGVDFAPNLAEFNAEFARPNLAVRSGYALDMLENGELKPDVVLMSSTAVVIKNAELRRYAEVVSRIARYYVFSEPLYLLPGDGVDDPLTVPVGDSRPAYAYAGRGDQPGPLCYTHNYKAILEEAGFEIVHYRAFRPSFTNLRMVQVIGRSPLAREQR